MLTAKQEKFCQAIADGKNQSDAYRLAYNAGSMKDATITSKAYELLKNGYVTARVKELKDLLAQKALWSREDSVLELANIVRGSEARPGEKVGAIKELNSMHGFNEATKHELAVTFPRVINVISGRA